MPNTLGGLHMINIPTYEHSRYAMVKVWHAKITLLWLCAAFLVCLFCFVCFVKLNVMWWSFVSSLIIFLYFMQGTIFGTCFELLGTTGNVDAMPYNPGECHQSVSVHHHYKVVHLPERLFPLMFNYVLWQYSFVMATAPRACRTCVLFSLSS